MKRTDRPSFPSHASNFFIPKPLVIPIRPPEILRGAQDDSLGFVILSTAKDLWRAFVQPPCLTWPCGLLGNHQKCKFWNSVADGHFGGKLPACLVYNVD